MTTAMHALQGYLYEMWKVEKNGSRTEIARSSELPTDPVQTDVHVPGGVWYLDVSGRLGMVRRRCTWTHGNPAAAALLSTVQP